MDDFSSLLPGIGGCIKRLRTFFKLFLRLVVLASDETYHTVTSEINVARTHGIKKFVEYTQ